MEKKGFYKFSKRTLLLLLAVIVLDIVMFLPGIYDAVTANGTSVQYVFVNFILILAPVLGLIDGLLDTKDKEK